MTPSPCHRADRRRKVYTAYNTLIVYGGPLLFAWLLYWIGSRQRMPGAWIIAGVAIVCVLGGFQNLIFYDTGCRGCGHLMASSGLYPPFPHVAEGLARAVLNLAIAGGAWWLATRRKASPAWRCPIPRGPRRSGRPARRWRPEFSQDPSCLAQVSHSRSPPCQRQGGKPGAINRSRC